MTIRLSQLQSCQQEQEIDNGGVSLKTWEINGISLEFDPEDADSMERYENAFDLMGKEETLF